MSPRIYISKHPCDDLPFIHEVDPDPRTGDPHFTYEGPDYSGWYIREKDLRELRWCLFHDSTVKSDPEHKSCRIADRSQIPTRAAMSCRLVTARLHIPGSDE